MICPVCGRESDNNQRFCMGCGTPLFQAAPAPMMPVAEPVAPAPMVEEVPVAPMMEEPVAPAPVIEEAPAAPVMEESVAPAPVIEEAPVAPAMAEPVAPAPIPAPIPLVNPVPEVEKFAPVETPKTEAVSAAPVCRPISDFDPKQLVRVKGSAWTGIATFFAIFFYCVASLAVIAGFVIGCFIKSLEIPFVSELMSANLGISIAILVGALLVLFIVFALEMMVLTAIRDVNKSRKHLKNIEYILKNK